MDSQNRRRHTRAPAGKQPTRRLYPGTLDELLCSIRQIHEEEPPAEAKATGSHWAMSDTSVTPGHMIETATPVHENDGDQTKPRLNKVLYDVIPECLTPDAYAFFRRTQQVKTFNPNVPVDPTQVYIFHVEAGMRIYELYSYIDSGADGANTRSLSNKIEADNSAPDLAKPDYRGPWMLETMGGAGGQTIGGVISTATHGGDINHSALGELVLAMHLIAPDGQEYWIERTQIRPGTIPLKLIDENELAQVYKPGGNGPGGAFRKKPIIYKRSDDLMNAAIVSCGRMGVIYSVVLRTIRQYALEQYCETRDWNEVRGWLSNPLDPTNAKIFSNHFFLRIDVDVYPKLKIDWHSVAKMFVAQALVAGPAGLLLGVLWGLEGDEHRAWLITRNTKPLVNATVTGDDGQPYPYGRRERAQDKTGIAVALGNEKDDGYFSHPCGTDNIIRTELNRAIKDLETIRADAAKAWLIAAAGMLNPLTAPLALKAQAVAVHMILFANFWAEFLRLLRDAMPSQARFGDMVAHVTNTLAHLKLHALVHWLYGVVAEDEHPDTKKPVTAIAYAIMDEHNYTNVACNSPGDSIEFFISANSPDLVPFIDSALKIVEARASNGEAFGGYISMRFMKESPSFLAMQQWPRTCSIEIAGLSKITGTGALIGRLELLAQKLDMRLHWGQRNLFKMEDIEKHFIPAPPNGHLFKWRQALSELSEHGRLANFSTEFTRLKGLEITKPRLYKLQPSLHEGCHHEQTTIAYDGFNNPSGTRLRLVQIFDDGQVIERVLPDLAGAITIPLGLGRSELQLHARRDLNGKVFEADSLKFSIRGFHTGDLRRYQFTPDSYLIGGQLRWYFAISLQSPYISNSLRVSGIAIYGNYSPGWILHNPDVGDVHCPGASFFTPFPGLPILNRYWQFTSMQAVGNEAPPVINVDFTMSC